MEPETMEMPMADDMRKKKRWSDLSARQHQIIVLAAIGELVMTTIAVADLVRRPARQLRGSRPLWLATFVVQPFGPIFYFLVGRRRPTR